MHHSPDGKGVHETEAWVFLSPEKQHDVDFHQDALQIMLDHYLREEGGRGQLTRRANKLVLTRLRVGQTWGRRGGVIIFTDGCARQYKGKRNFQRISLSPHRLGVVITLPTRLSLQRRNYPMAV